MSKRETSIERDVSIRVICGSSEDAPSVLSELKNTFALAVTSPPYHNAISYTTHTRNPKANYRERSSQSYGDEYMSLLEKVWNATYEMLKPGGYFAVNVGSVLDNGYHYPLAEDIIHQMTVLGKWEYVKSIFWHKVTAGVKRAGSVIQHPLPGYWHPNIMTEHLILVRKSGPIRKPASDIPSDWLDPIWDIAPVPPGRIDHPAPFPEEIPHRLIRMFSDKGDWILDPFNGAGTTTKASFDLGRHAVGFDVEPAYVELALERLELTSSVREKQLSIRPVLSENFVPGPSRGKTRQGSGIAGRGKSR